MTRPKTKTVQTILSRTPYSVVVNRSRVVVRILGRAYSQYDDRSREVCLGIDADEIDDVIELLTAARDWIVVANRDLATHAGHVPREDGSCSDACYRIGG